MSRFPFFFLLLSSLLLSACGSGGDDAVTTSPAPTLAAGLSWVDVQDGEGHTVMQHRYALGNSADEEIVTTTQYQGNDGIWGTADDWRSAITRCRFQPGDAVSPVGFGPETFLDVSVSLCSVRRPLAGTVQAEIHGARFSDELLSDFRPETATDSMNILVDSLGLRSLLNAGDFISFLERFYGVDPLLAHYSVAADAAGLSLCAEDCVRSGTETSLPIACGNLCGMPTSPVSDGLPINLNQYSCGASMVDVYDGIRAQVMLSSSRLDKVVYSSALTSPYCYVTGYDQNRYDSNGQLSSVETYAERGVDGIWLNADDVLTGYLQQQKLPTGWQRIYYEDAGADGLWKTGDDIVARGVALELDAAGRIATLRVCRPVNADPFPTDNFWQTGSESCSVMIFHYATPAP